MPIDIVLDSARRHVGRRLRQFLSAAAGGLLVLVGLLASIVAGPATFFVVGIVVGLLAGDDAEPFPPPDMPVGAIVIAWAISTPLAVGGIKAGLHLLRKHRKLVLFLRRFGHDEAQLAVTYAVTNTIGRSWRVVTLDDAEIAPVGLPATTRHVFGIGRIVSKALSSAAMWLGYRLFPIAVNAAWLVGGIGVLTSDSWEEGFETYLPILTGVFEWQLPFDRIGPTLPGLFAAIVSVAAVSFVVLGVVFVALVIALPLSPILFFVSSSASAVQEAERAKTVDIATARELDAAIPVIVQRSRKVFGPRLVVLRVATRIWQEAVSRLAAASAVPIIDVSEPTMNLLWEIDELSRRFGDRCVLIGHEARVSRLAAAPDGASAAPFERQLATMLDGRQVLAYRTDRRGMRRFARALRSRLLAATDGRT